MSVYDPSEAHGWRGNQERWVQNVLTEIPRLGPSEWRRLAPLIDDTRLLRPAVACVVPVHRPQTFHALWTDTQALVLGGRNTPKEKAPQWLGALVYYVRHRPRMSWDRVQDLKRSYPQTWRPLKEALCDEAWTPSALVDEVCRTRTILVLLAIDQAEPCLRLRASEWLASRPLRHGTVALYRNLGHPPTATRLPNFTVEDNDPFRPTALLFFDDSDVENQDECQYGPVRGLEDEDEG